MHAWLGSPRSIEDDDMKRGSIAFIMALALATPAFAQDTKAGDGGPNAANANADVYAPYPFMGRMGRGMMGRGMMGYGGGYGYGMMPMMGLGGRSHAEGRLAFLKAELKITDAQAPQWNAFAEAVRTNASSMREMRRAMMAERASATLPERLALADKTADAHLAAMKKTREALTKLYAVLNDTQKKTADTIVVGPMGMPMGMM
jgi:hypothetical protein